MKTIFKTKATNTGGRDGHVKSKDGAIDMAINMPDAEGKTFHDVQAGQSFWSIAIEAQLYLVRFYEGFGFRRAGEEYLEDGIVHVYMMR